MINQSVLGSLSIQPLESYLKQLLKAVRAPLAARPSNPADVITVAHIS